jgi:prepilin-type N-terminal cleavage/methylation domain-containing protein
MGNRTNAGFSLVEVLVAAAVIAISLFMVAGFVRNSQKLISLDRHHRMARAIMRNALETAQFQPENYYSLATGCPTAGQSVVIDAGRTPNLTGILKVCIKDEVTTTPTNTGIPVPYRKIVDTVSWTEPDAGTQTVNGEKWLTNVQR